MGLGGIALLLALCLAVQVKRSTSSTKSPAASEGLSGPASPRSEAGSVESRPEPIAQFVEARRRRDWAEVRRIREALRDTSESTLQSLLASSEDILLLAGLLEEARNAPSEELLPRLRGIRWEELDSSGRGEYFRYLLRFGGVLEEEEMANLVSSASRPEVQRDAALALGKYAKGAAVAHVRMEGGLSTVYSILALDQMAKRGAIPAGDATRGGWKKKLEELVEFDSPFASREAVHAIAAVEERSSTAVLAEMIQRSDASEELRRKAIGIFREIGHAEDLELVGAVPAALRNEWDATRREMLRGYRAPEEGPREE